MKKEANMTIRVKQASREDARSVYDFETFNRLYFQQNLPPRPKAYKQFDTFEVVYQQLLLEQEQGTYAMYLILDDKQDLVGRINLTIDLDQKTGELGFRIGEKSQGQGIASQAVALVLASVCRTCHLTQVEAGTAVQNGASQKVLEKNGFEKIGLTKKVIKINGEWIDGFTYLKQLPA